MRSFVAER